MGEKYSYTKLGTYDSCPFKFKLQYVDKHYAFTGGVATEFGTAVHETEETIARAIKAGEPIDYISIKNELLIKFAKIENTYKDQYLLDDNKSGRNYRDKAYQYLETGIYGLENFMKAHPTYEIVGIEEKFNFQFDEDHNFNGAIDRVFRDKETGNYLIQDIKTWPVPEKDEDLVTPLQFVVYTLAAKDLWGAEPEQVKCQYYLPLVDCMTQDGGTKGFMNRGITKINKIFKDILTKQFKPSLSALCNWCAYCVTNPDAKEEFKYLCPYHSIWVRETRNKSDMFRGEVKWEGLEEHERILEAYQKKYNIQKNDTLN